MYLSWCLFCSLPCVHGHFNLSSQLDSSIKENSPRVIPLAFIYSLRVRLKAAFHALKRSSSPMKRYVWISTRRTNISFVLSDSRFFHKDLNSRSMKLIIPRRLKWIQKQCSFNTLDLCLGSKRLELCTRYWLSWQVVAPHKVCLTRWLYSTLAISYISVPVSTHCLQFLC